MTETKQYTVKRWYDESAIYDGDELFAIVDVRMQANNICKRLNLLSEENGQLKKENLQLKGRIMEYEEQIETNGDRILYYCEKD